MVTPTSACGRRCAYLPSVDPRLRIVAAVALSMATALVARPRSAAMALAFALALAAVSGVPWRVLARRLLPLNVIVLLFAAITPLTLPGRPWAAFQGLTWSVEGVRLATMIALKGNAIVLLLGALVSPIDPVVFGHALAHLRVPDKLTVLFLFAVRYLSVLHAEQDRLRRSMKARGFRPRMNAHTYRSLSHLAGMLLVRSHDRAERVSAAMKCRGFRGRFYLLDHFHYHWSDAPFLAASLIATAALIWLEIGRS